MDMSTVNALAAQLGELLLAADWRITTAESCTGGLLAAAITHVAGSSGWFNQSVVTYSNEAKEELLGVDKVLLETEGAVSSGCVDAMAEGALRAAGAQVAVAVSGIAGPGGATPGKPVGCVFIGWALASAAQADISLAAKDPAFPTSERFVFPGDRQAIREQAVIAALRGTISRINECRIDYEI